MENVLHLLYDMCRLCLERNGQHNLFSEPNFVREIAECAGVQLEPDPSLPQMICSVCIERLRVCRTFRDIVSKSDWRLRQLRVSDDNGIDEHEIAPLKHIRTHHPNMDPLNQNERPPEEKEIDDITQKRICVRADIFEKFDQQGSSARSRRTSSATTRDRDKKPNLDISFKYNDTQLKHERLLKQEDLICDICNKECANQRALYHHRRGHIKNHLCPLCSKAFAYRNDLKKHMRIHTGEKPFACTVCGKAFTQAGTLKAHMDIHERLLNPNNARVPTTKIEPILPNGNIEESGNCGSGNETDNSNNVQIKRESYTESNDEVQDIISTPDIENIASLHMNDSMEELSDNPYYCAREGDSNIDDFHEIRMYPPLHSISEMEEINVPGAYVTGMQ